MSINHVVCLLELIVWWSAALGYLIHFVPWVTMLFAGITVAFNTKQFAPKRLEILIKLFKSHGNLYSTTL